MSAAFDVATRLQTLGHGTVGTDIGVNAFMDKGDNEIAVFEYPGEPEITTHGGGVQIEYFAIQVEVRNKSNQTAQTTCYNIYKALRDSKDLSLGGYIYDYVQPKRLPAKMSVDEQLRTIWYCEVQVSRKPV